MKKKHIILTIILSLLAILGVAIGYDYVVKKEEKESLMNYLKNRKYIRLR